MIIFGENNFIFRFVGYGLVTKSLESECTFEKVAEKTKCEKDECEYFYNQIRMNHLT